MDSQKGPKTPQNLIFCQCTKQYNASKRYATALLQHHILHAKNLLWPVVSWKRRVATVEFGVENRLFSMVLAIIVAMGEYFVLHQVV